MMIAGNKDTVTIANQCPFCAKHYTFEVPTDEYSDWVFNNKLIQEAFKSLNATKREFLLSGLCEDCQKKIFGDEDD